jgi:hypothetical protein
MEAFGDDEHFARGSIHNMKKAPREEGLFFTLLRTDKISLLKNHGGGLDAEGYQRTVVQQLTDVIPSPRIES